MHNFKKFFYGLLLISMCPFDLANTVDYVGSTSKNETAVGTVKQDNITSTPSNSIAVEGGSFSPSVDQDKTHLSREHVVDESSAKLPLFNKSGNGTIVDNPIGKPVIESSEIDLGVSRKNDNTKVVAKKGAPVDNSTSTINITSVSTSTVTPNTIPKKPTLTEPGDQSLAISDAKYNKSGIQSEKMSSFNTVLKKKSNRADYVIPIVAVILSVPLVAIIISALYKRGTYWWQHRNYRRMDFLIEGMYNN